MPESVSWKGPFCLIYLLLLLVSPLRIDAAEGMWDSVFAYQQKMANYGQAEAQLKLGEMYEDGLGTEQNFDSAEQWYQKALDQGFAPAQDKLNKLQQRRQQATDAFNEQLRAEQQRLLREKVEQERRAQEQADRARAEKELAEEQKAELDKSEEERLAREAAQQQEQDKLQAAEDERLARKRAQEAIKKMMAVPGGYEQ